MMKKGTEMYFWLGSLSKGCDLCQEDWQCLYLWDLFMHADMDSLGTSFFSCYFPGDRCRSCSEKGAVADCNILTCCPSCHLEYASPELPLYKVQPGSYVMSVYGLHCGLSKWRGDNFQAEVVV